MRCGTEVMAKVCKTAAAPTAHSKSRRADHGRSVLSDNNNRHSLMSTSFVSGDDKTVRLYTGGRIGRIANDVPVFVPLKK